MSTATRTAPTTPAASPAARPGSKDPLFYRLGWILVRRARLVLAVTVGVLVFRPPSASARSAGSSAAASTTRLQRRAKPRPC